METDTKPTDLGFNEDEDDEIFPSRTRLGRLAGAVAIALALFHFWAGYSGGFGYMRQRAVHLAGALLVLLFMRMDRTRGKRATPRRMVLGAMGAVYVGFLGLLIVRVDWVLTLSRGVPPLYLLLAGAAVLVGLEMSRVVVGWVLPGIALVVGALVLLAHPLKLPLRDWMAPATWQDLVQTLGFSNHGLLGSITSVSAGVVASFLLFGALLNVSGGAQSFLNLARFLVGRFRGGPGKVSLITSAFFGTASGSAVANVVVDGVFNIPLMKRSGFSPSFAAAVEAATSTGGQLVPPVMGAAAFVLAEFLGVPYTQVIIAAIVPCLLYYAGLFMAIHIEALRHDLPRIPKEELPKRGDLVTREFVGSFILPMAVLFGTLFGFGRSLALSSFYASLTIVLYILLGTKLPWRERAQRVVLGLRRGGDDIARVAAIVVAAQVLISILGVSGLGTRVANELAGAPIPRPLALAFLAAVVILLGFGVPTVGAYILAASIAGPVFGSLGIEPLAGHMFLLYISVYANITPPVMPATYAAVAIARADLMRAGIEGTRLLLPALFVPFAMALRPGLLLNSGSLVDTVTLSLEVLVGMGAIAAGLARWFRGPLGYGPATLLVVGGCLLAWPSRVASAAGVGLLAAGALPALRRKGPITSGVVRGPGVVAVSADRVDVVHGEPYADRLGRMRAVLANTDMPGLRLHLGAGQALAIGGQTGRTAFLSGEAAQDLGATVHIVPAGCTAEQLEEIRSRTRAAVAAPRLIAGWRDVGLPAVPETDLELISGARDAEPAPPGQQRGPLVVWDADAAAVLDIGGRPEQLASLGRAFGFGPTVRLLVSLPPEDIGGAVLARGALAAKAVLVFDERAGEFDPAQWLDTVTRAEVTSCVMSFEQLQAAATHVSETGAAVPASLSQIVHARQPGGQPTEHAMAVFGPIMTTYLAAGGFPVALLTSEEWLERPDLAGRLWSDQLRFTVKAGADGYGELLIQAPAGLLPRPLDGAGSDASVTVSLGREARMTDDGTVHLRQELAGPGLVPLPGKP